MVRQGCLWVEGWLVGTMVVTSSAACEGGGGEARTGAKGAAIGSGGAGSREGATSGSWVGTGQPGAVLLPIWTWSLWGQWGATMGLHSHLAS